MKLENERSRRRKLPWGRGFDEGGLAEVNRRKVFAENEVVPILTHRRESSGAWEEQARAGELRGVRAGDNFSSLKPG